MVMSVLLHDAVGTLSDAAKIAYNRGDLADVVYADDTLLMGADEKNLQKLLTSIADIGGQYGMEFHWSKFQLIQIHHEYHLRTPTGVAIPAKELLSYLGVNIYADGGIKSE